MFLVLAGLNLYIADRTAPKAFPANVHPYVERFHEVFGHRLRLVRYCTAAVLALFLALPAAGHWQDWLLFRNSTPFGVEDAQFGADVGFYVFELPFISFVVDWLFAAMVVVLLLTLAAHLLNGGVLFASSTPSVRAGDEGPPRRAARGPRDAQGGRLLADPLSAHERAVAGSCRARPTPSSTPSSRR